MWSVSGGRKLERGRPCKSPVGNTVDVANAMWTNTIGAPELITVWKDPLRPCAAGILLCPRTRDPDAALDCVRRERFGIKPLPGTTMTLQERAYTSPIWYTPEK